MSNLSAIKSANDLILDNQAMQNIMLFANTMASGKVTVPKHLQGNVSDCLAITMQSVQWGMSPFVVAQKTHLVNGNLGYEAQLVNAVVVNSGFITGRFYYEYGGNWPNGADAWVRCGAVIAGESDIQWGEPLYPANVSTKNSPLWKTNPKQQAAYLAVKYWARMYCPAAIMGVYSVDELEEFPQERDITPQPQPNSQLDQMLESVKNKEIKKHIEEQNMLDISNYFEKLEQCGDLASFAAIVQDIAAIESQLTDSQLSDLRSASKSAKARIKAGSVQGQDQGNDGFEFD